MVHFLENITELYDKIEVTSVSDYKTINKCIDIKNHIDLDKILRKLRRRRNRQLQTLTVETQPSPKPVLVQKPPTCTCLIKSTKKPCENKARPGSHFCGVHKNCKI
jgi:hypothetical protein